MTNSQDILNKKLIEAVCGGKCAEIMLLVHEGADVRCFNDKPLNWAVHHGATEVFVSSRKIFPKNTGQAYTR